MKKNRNRKGSPAVKITAVVLIALCWIFYILQGGAGKGEKLFLTVEKGESLSHIADRLKENGIIRNREIFILTAKMKKADSRIKAGTHIFSGYMNNVSVVDELTENRGGKEVLFTVPEGWTAAQIQEKLSREKIGKTTEKFAKRATDLSVVPYKHICGTSLEGYLFPDTYALNEEITDSELCEKMINNFNDKVIVPYFNDIIVCGTLYFGEEDFDRSLYKVLTVASLVEREVRVPSERKKVASVIYNRLKKGMPLQIDATVSYVPGRSTDNKEKVYYRDLKKKTPYNTYVIKGLPKGPICNPGLESIKAALRPEKTDYLYYVAKPDGSHIFTDNFRQHKINKNKQ